MLLMSIRLMEKVQPWIFLSWPFMGYREGSWCLFMTKCDLVGFWLTSPRVSHRSERRDRKLEVTQIRATKYMTLNWALLLNGYFLCFWEGECIYSYLYLRFVSHALYTYDHCITSLFSISISIWFVVVCCLVCWD